MEIYLSISAEVIPNELVPRFHSLEWFMGYVLFIAFITLAIARFARVTIYESLVVANGKFQGVVSFVKDAMPLGKLSSLLLLANYALSGGAVCYLYFQSDDSIQLSNDTFAFLIPISLLAWNLLSFQLTHWLTGSAGVFEAPITVKIIGAQFLGLVYFFCAVLWLFISGQGTMFAQLVLILFCTESVFRIIKSVNLVLKRGVSWYYIILYFCTLEILPLLMIYMALTGEFN